MAERENRDSVVFDSEVEIGTLKDVIWRLTTRVYLLEDFISEQFGTDLGSKGYSIKHTLIHSATNNENIRTRRNVKKRKTKGETVPDFDAYNEDCTTSTNFMYVSGGENSDSVDDDPDYNPYNSKALHSSRGTKNIRKRKRLRYSYDTSEDDEKSKITSCCGLEADSDAGVSNSGNEKVKKPDNIFADAAPQIKVEGFAVNEDLMDVNQTDFLAHASERSSENEPHKEKHNVKVETKKSHRHCKGEKEMKCDEPLMTQIRSDPDIRVFKSQQGRDKVFHAGFTYNFAGMSKFGAAQWVCERRNTCKGRLRYSEDIRAELRTAHSHPEDFDRDSERMDPDKRDESNKKYRPPSMGANVVKCDESLMKLIRADPEVRVEKSQKGRDKVIHGGFTYNFAGMSRYGAGQWACERRNTCKGRLRYCKDVGAQLRTQHSHDADPARAEELDARKKIREMKAAGMPPGVIFQSAIEGVSTEVAARISKVVIRQ